MKKLIALVLIVAGCGYFGAKFYLHYRVSAGLDDALLMASSFADIEYRGVSSTMSGELSIDGITVRLAGFRDPLYIDKLSMITPGFFYLLNLVELGQSGADFELYLSGCFLHAPGVADRGSGLRPARRRGRRAFRPARPARSGPARLRADPYLRRTRSRACGLLWLLRFARRLDRSQSFRQGRQGLPGTLYSGNPGPALFFGAAGRLQQGFGLN